MVQALLLFIFCSKKEKREKNKINFFLYKVFARLKYKLIKNKIKIIKNIGFYYFIIKMYLNE